MVKRYKMEDQIFCDDQYALMVEEDKGDYVAFEDFEKLQKLFIKMTGLVGMNQARPKEQVLNDYKKLVGDQ